MAINWREVLLANKTVVNKWLRSVWPDMRQNYTNIYDADDQVSNNITPDDDIKF